MIFKVLKSEDETPRSLKNKEIPVGGVGEPLDSIGIKCSLTDPVTKPPLTCVNNTSDESK